MPRIAGSNLAKSNEPLYRPPAPAGSANRRVDQFHPASCTGVSVFVQCQPPILAVSPYRCGRSDYEYFFYPTPGPDFLDGFLRCEPSRDRCLSLRGFGKNPEQFGIETDRKAPNPCKSRSVRQCRPDFGNGSEHREPKNNLIDCTRRNWKMQIRVVRTRISTKVCNVYQKSPLFFVLSTRA